MHIHISNLSTQVQETDILVLLKVYASVGHCAIYHVRNSLTREPQTYAIVNMNSDIDIESAVKLLNGTVLQGRKIVVQVGT